MPENSQGIFTEMVKTYALSSPDTMHDMRQFRSVPYKTQKKNQKKNEICKKQWETKQKREAAMVLILFHT